ncbi:hypothetical protein DJ90_6485 [Paenibacillus macerans]|uniref:Uncharacterized protein n=1 Tax=Paenibacillus macerans TaxID=44252 RepID=A0A090YPU0_PAEMA|nr:hypothetical protein DJ90_6485 [Paenibacillus macerans]
MDSPLTWRRFVTLLETATVQKVDTLTSPNREASTSLTFPQRSSPKSCEDTVRQ